MTQRHRDARARPVRVTPALAATSGEMRLVDVAQLLGLAPRQVYRWCFSGGLRHRTVRYGGVRAPAGGGAADVGAMGL